MTTKTIYSYSIIAAQEAIVTDLESRSLAREELQLVKKQGYPTAKIIQSKYTLEQVRQVR